MGKGRAKVGKGRLVEAGDEGDIRKSGDYKKLMGNLKARGGKMAPKRPMSLAGTPLEGDHPRRPDGY